MTGSCLFSPPAPVDGESVKSRQAAVAGTRLVMNACEQTAKITGLLVAFNVKFWLKDWLHFSMKIPEEVDRDRGAQRATIMGPITKMTTCDLAGVTLRAEMEKLRSTWFGWQGDPPSSTVSLIHFIARTYGHGIKSTISHLVVLVQGFHEADE